MSYILTHGRTVILNKRHSLIFIGSGLNIRHTRKSNVQRRLNLYRKVYSFIRSKCSGGKHISCLSKHSLILKHIRGHISQSSELVVVLIGTAAITVGVYLTGSRFISQEITNGLVNIFIRLSSRGGHKYPSREHIRNMTSRYVGTNALLRNTRAEIIISYGNVMLVNKRTYIVVPRFVFIVESDRCSKHITEHLTLGSVSRYRAKLCGRELNRECGSVIVGNLCYLVFNACHKLLFIFRIKKIVAPVVNESGGKHYVTKLTLLVTVYLLNIESTKELLHTVNSLISVKLVAVNKISESLYLNNLKVIAVVVMRTGSAKIISLSCAKLTHIYTAVSLAVYNGVGRRTVAIKRSGLIYVHIKKRKEALVGGVLLLKSLSYRRNVIPCYEKTGMVLRNSRKKSIRFNALVVPSGIINVSNTLLRSSKAVSVSIIFNFVFEDSVYLLEAL